MAQLVTQLSPVEGWRGTEDGDRILVESVQHCRGREPRHAVYEDCAALGPRPEDGGPGALGPTRVRYVPHDVILGEVQPVFPHHMVTVAVGAVCVTYHLGSSCGAASEVNL